MSIRENDLLRQLKAAEMNDEAVNAKIYPPEYPNQHYFYVAIKLTQELRELGLTNDEIAEKVAAIK